MTTSGVASDENFIKMRTFLLLYIIFTLLFYNMFSWVFFYDRLIFHLQCCIKMMRNLKCAFQLSLQFKQWQKWSVMLTCKIFHTLSTIAICCPATSNCAINTIVLCLDGTGPWVLYIAGHVPQHTAFGNIYCERCQVVLEAWKGELLFCCMNETYSYSVGIWIS